MTNDSKDQITSILDQLTVSYRKIFQSKLRSLWLSSGDPFNLSNQIAVDDSYNLLESNAADLISETARQALAVSKKPRTFAEISKAISLYLTQVEGDLAGQISSVKRTMPRSALEGRKIEEFRRRMERLIDAYSIAFTDNHTPELNPFHSIRIITPDLVSTAGRKVKYKWVDAACIIFGEIHFGDFKPTLQKEVEERLIALLRTEESEPDLETVRPTAGKIFRAVSVDPEEEN